MKTGICGHFMFGEAACNGQAIKTKNYYSEMCKHYSEKNVLLLDTNCFKKKFLLNIWKCILIAKRTEAVVVMPTQSILCLFAPLFSTLKAIFKCKVFYVVVGGWLPEVVASKDHIRKGLESFDGILVETNMLKFKLENLGLTKVILSPNFSTRKPVDNTQIINRQWKKPYQLCTFSRVTKTKGIIEAIDAVGKLNDQSDDLICNLTIYGQIDPEFQIEFEDALGKNKSLVKYGGVLNGDNIILTLSEYYLMLFPTYYPGECFPGAIAEAMMAGVPVIATNWRYNEEVIIHEKTGIIYSSEDSDGLYKNLSELISSPDKVQKLRINSLEERKKYSPEKIMEILYELIDE